MPLPYRPHLEYEYELAALGVTAVAGIDEVGRGTLAGPVVAGTAILPGRVSGDWWQLVRDSKQMTPGQRQHAYVNLSEACVAVSTGACDAFEIDRIGIVAATRLAMARAIESLDVQPGHLLIDALTLPEIPIPQTAIIKGDAISLSIAAASIIAKVTRDRLMETVFEDSFPGYGFAENKGYGTAAHFLALETLGPSPAHRFSFAPIRDTLSPRRAVSDPADWPQGYVELSDAREATA